MSAQAEAPEQEHLDVIVFEGSSSEDVSHARKLWSSLFLVPPLESRLVSANIRQRLPVFRSQRSSSTAGPAHFTPLPPSVPALRQGREERQRYEAMADQRMEVLALLRRHREQRIQKELMGFNAKLRFGPEKTIKLQKRADCEVEEELVKQLQ